KAPRAKKKLSPPPGPLPEGVDVDLTTANIPKAKDLPRRLFFDWSSGPGGQIEIVGGKAPYKINYTLQWRPAIRRPMQDLPLDERGYKEILRRLTALKGLLNEGDSIYRKHRGEPTSELSAALEQNRTNTVNSLSFLGSALDAYIIPQRMKDAR